MPVINSAPDITNNIYSNTNAILLSDNLTMLKPAIRKYIALLKNARKVDWLARTVLCNASFSRRIRSFFTAGGCSLSSVFFTMIVIQYYYDSNGFFRRFLKLSITGKLPRMNYSVHKRFPDASWLSFANC